MHANIHIDLFSDWAEILGGKLAELGYVLPSSVDSEKRCIYYYDIADRTPSSTPREILKADSFTCPLEHAAGLRALEEKIRDGKDLRSHLSLGILNPDNFDGLLLDWGVHHLHLGLVPHPQTPGFVERTGPLLYVRFGLKTAYFIGVMNHGIWSQQDLIRILYRNWPDSIEKYRVKGVMGLTFVPSDSDIGKLRKSHVNTLIEIEPGLIFCHLGSGISTAGTSMRSVMKLNQAKRFFDRAEKGIHEKYDQWRHEGVNPDSVFKFKLTMEGESMYAFSADQRIAIKIS